MLRLVRHDCDTSSTLYTDKSELWFQIGHTNELKQDVRHPLSLFAPYTRLNFTPHMSVLRPTFPVFRMCVCKSPYCSFYN